MTHSDVDPNAAQHDVVGRHTGLVRRTALVSVLTLGSRVFGYAREALTASLFGDHSAVNDALVTAWRVPNLVRGMLTEGAVAAALQNAITRADDEHGLEAGGALFRAILSVVARWLCWISLAGIALALLMPDTMPFTGWRWLGGSPELVRDLAARTLPFVVLAGLAATAGGALQVRGRFFAPSFGPLAMNVAWVTLLFTLHREHRAGLSGTASEISAAHTIVWGILGAGLLLFAVQLPSLWSSGLLGRRAARADPAEVRRILAATLPVALGAAALQINLLVGGLMAEGLLREGGPAALYYATRLQQFPLALVSFAATSAVFPTLSALGHRGDLASVRRLHDATHLAIAFVALPAALGLLVFAQPICAACLGHGAYGSEGVERMAAALRWLALGILPAGAVGLLARTFYALGDYRTPVRVALAMIAVSTALNLLLVVGFGMDADGFGLGFALSALIQLVWMGRALRGPGLPPSEAAWGSRLGRISAAAAIAVSFASAARIWLAPTLGETLALAATILLAAGIYAGVCVRLAVPEAQTVLKRLRGGGAERPQGPG